MLILCAVQGRTRTLYSETVTMPKIKTNKAVAKRVKITARGKVLVRRGGAGHLKSRKSPRQIRRFRLSKQLSPGFAKQAKRMLGR